MSNLTLIFKELRDRLHKATPANGFHFALGNAVHDAPQNLTTESAMPCCVITMGESRSDNRVANSLSGKFIVDVHLEAHMLKPQPTPGVEELTDTELALSLLHELQRAVLCDGVVIIAGTPIAKIEDVTSGVTRIKPDGLPIISVGVLLRVSYTQTFK